MNGIQDLGEPYLVGDVLAVPPPLDADDLRISILTRLKQYRELHSTLRRKNEGTRDNRSQEAARYPPEHRTIQFSMVQGSLLRDIRELSLLTKELEHQLISKRWKKWLIHTSLALLSHAFYVLEIPSLTAHLFHTRPISQYHPVPGHRSFHMGMFSRVLNILQWSGYPVAIYTIASSEKRITETTRLRGDLKVMETRVEKALEVPDVDCFETITWGCVPWESMKTWADNET